MVRSVLRQLRRCSENDNDSTSSPVLEIPIAHPSPRRAQHTHPEMSCRHSHLTDIGTI
jgi:hypothetical protein